MDTYQYLLFTPKGVLICVQNSKRTKDLGDGV
jgi:flavin reductase (DIM6/NTAB) family NADH-FMN oxidoreductase RutF